MKVGDLVRYKTESVAITGIIVPWSHVARPSHHRAQAPEDWVTVYWFRYNSFCDEPISLLELLNESR